MNYQINFTFKPVGKAGKMLSVFVALFLFGFATASFGQGQTNKAVDGIYHSLEPSEIAKYSHYDFKGNFAVLLESDKTSNYFFLDLSKMNSSFELKYFLYLAYQSGNGVQTSHGLGQNRAWLIADIKNSAGETLKQILKMKQTAMEKEKSLTESEKKDWIKSKNY